MNNIKQDSKNHFDSIASEYDTSFDGRFVEPMYKGILEALSEISAKNLLDVGCGNGNILAALGVSKQSLYGIDLSEGMINAAKARLGSGVNLFIADAEHMPFKESFFEAMVCNASFHHYPHPVEVLTEMRRVIKKQGILLIGEGYAPQPLRGFLNLSFKYAKSGDYHSYGKKEMKLLLQSNGFSLLEVRKLTRQSVLYIAKAI